MLVADYNFLAQRTVSEEYYAGQRLHQAPTPTTGPAVHLKNVALERRSGDTCGFISDPSYKGSLLLLHGDTTYAHNTNLKVRSFARAV